MVVDIFAYNSKKYYVMTQGAGFGDNVATAPITGNETVLDAVATVGGLSQLSSKKIWVARPAPNGVGCEQVLPVNWDDITRALDGDELSVVAGRPAVYRRGSVLVRSTAGLQKLTAPFERLFGLVSSARPWPTGSIASA